MREQCDESPHGALLVNVDHVDAPEVSAWFDVCFPLLELAVVSQTFSIVDLRRLTSSLCYHYDGGPSVRVPQ